MSSITITGLADAGALVGTEFIELAQRSTTVFITAVTLSALAADNSYNDSGAGFIAAGFAVDDRVNVVGFTGNVANNISVGVITALTAGKMTIGGTDGDVIVDDAAGESVTISKWVSRRFVIGTAIGLNKDTDGTLAANSDTRLATQKAVKTYVDGVVVGLFDPKGSTDCSANPNYPAALKGDVYVVSVDGKIGGGAGADVQVGDVYWATADNAGGTQAAVGASWDIIEHNLPASLPLTGGTLSGDLIVPPEAYGAPWNGSNEVPTKNDVYDKIEAVVGGIPGTYTNENAMDAIAAMLAAGSHTGLTVTYNDAGDAMSLAVTITQYTDEMAQDTIGALFADTATIDVTYNDAGNVESLDVIQTALKPTEHIAIACSDETTAITAGTSKVTFRMPYAFTVTDVRASVNTAPTGSTILIDINEAGTTILSTKLMIDAGEKTSTTAATPAVISDTTLADDAEMTIDFDQVGSTIAGKGVKVILIGHRT